MSDVKNLIEEVENLIEKNKALMEKSKSLDSENFTDDGFEIIGMPSVIEECPPSNTSKEDSVAKEPDYEEKKNHAGAILADILFYVSIAVLVFAAFAYGADKSQVKTFFGYSYMNVLTTSMQSEIPQNSFILVKNVDPAEIEIDDDITYMTNQSQTVTHRVIDIFENYNDMGMRGFVTQGIENPNPDEEVVYAENVVGVVKVVVPELGAGLTYISENFLYLIIFFVIFIILAFCLRVLFRKESKKEHEKTEVLFITK